MGLRTETELYQKQARLIERETPPLTTAYAKQRLAEQRELDALTRSFQNDPSAPQPQPHPQVKHRGHKLRRLAIGAAMLLSNLPTPSNAAKSPVEKYNQELATFNATPRVEQEVQLPAAPRSRVSAKERDMIAKMVYGEAGLGADRVEVIHTVLNRLASPLFSDHAGTVVSQKNQYVGYNENNPVDPELRALVDMVVDEWEANGCQAIDGCPHYYFVTGIPGVCNKFEISDDGAGRWVSVDEKHYAQMRKYCAAAVDQNNRFRAEQNIKYREKLKQVAMNDTDRELQ